MKTVELAQFQVDVPRTKLQDLQHRLANTRWSYQARGANWDQGTDINQLAQYKADIGDIGVHFVHERGQGPNLFPLILTHGYPDSFYRFAKIIPMLTDPARFGGNAEDAFDVVVPDLPGYGFSDRPISNGMIFRVHDLWAQLMTEALGYKKFGAHGGDWGGTVTEQLALHHPDAVAAIHLTDVPFGHLFQKPRDPSAEEEKFLKASEEWMKKEGAYAQIQSTKPQSLAQGLNDSPAGLAAWMIEKFQSWSDCHGKIESRFSKDEILSHVMIYWMTESIGPSFLPYYDFANAGALTWMKEGIQKVMNSSKVPAAFALFPKDISQPPRHWAERFFDVQRWTEMPRGGHFAAMEEPELLAADLRDWFRPFRRGAGAN